MDERTTADDDGERQIVSEIEHAAYMAGWDHPDAATGGQTASSSPAPIDEERLSAQLDSLASELAATDGQWGGGRWGPAAARDHLTEIVKDGWEDRTSDGDLYDRWPGLRPADDEPTLSDR